MTEHTHTCTHTRTHTHTYMIALTLVSRAAGTKYHKWSGVSNRNVTHNSAGCKGEAQVLSRTTLL